MNQSSVSSIPSPKTIISYSAPVLFRRRYCSISKFAYKWWVFIWSACEELQWRYWWQIVPLECTSVVIEPFARLALRSKNETLFSEDSYVNWRFWSPSIDYFSSTSPCVQIKKILSIYLNHTIRWGSCILKRFVLVLPI